MSFVTHWNESAMDLHVFPILIPPPTSPSIRSLWVFPVHQAWALISCIQPGLVVIVVTGHFPCLNSVPKQRFFFFFLDNNVQQRSFVPFHLWFTHSYIFINVLRAFINGLTQDSSPTIWCLLHDMGQRKGEQKRNYQKQSENFGDLRINKGS